MAFMFNNDNCPFRNFGDSSQLKIWILDSGKTCHMTPEVSNFITGLLDNTDKYTVVADGRHITKKKGKYE